MTCTSCRLGRPWECGEDEQCSSDILSGNDSGSSLGSPLPIASDDVFYPTDSDGAAEEKSGPVREINTYKSDASLKDQQSTGRKRAAAMYPLFRDDACEWSRKKNCGGGANPITGCLDGKQQARHHGPDKNTLNNDEGNVHRICHSCHNNWHAANDGGYVWGNVYPSHSPIEANDIELMLEKVRRSGQAYKNVED
jgi:hypothetical protein